ncbi:outer membrane efflux protein [Desulfosarcina variabilis str. Montpellier]|uniref:TolC family protein n=1 Tax=Desulfosarcina variabilis TaxID=2300 RepID=UPI003AFB775E
MSSYMPRWCTCALILINISFYFFPVLTIAQTEASSKSQTILQEADLDACLKEALKNNRRRPASRYAVEMAEARHRQALAGYWPQISAKGGYLRMDESPNFLFPSSTMSLPMGGSLPITIPGVGTVPVSSIDVPAQDVKLMDEDNYWASLNATWLLYDGGMRKGYREQSGALVEMMKQECRRTDLEVIDSVKRLYYGAVLARQLHQVGKDTLARMGATLNLTETMYKKGSGAVKKTDWLDNKVMVESLRAMVALLEKNELMAQAALANTMGLPWNTSVVPVDRKMPFTSFMDQLDRLVGTAYQFNPDWSKIEAGLRAAQGAVRTAKSGHYPKLAVTGQLHRWWNDYDGGLATESNKKGWTVGLGLELPLFSGLLTHNKIAEARAQVAKLKEERFLLKEGIGLQIKDTVLSLGAAEKSHQATLEAMQAAGENRDLNVRAYQHELVETEKVIRAQLIEALMSAQHYKARYDHIALRSQLSLVVGREVLKKIQ